MEYLFNNWSTGDRGVPCTFYLLSGGRISSLVYALNMIGESTKSILKENAAE